MIRVLTTTIYASLFEKIFVEVELEDTRQENMTLRWQNGAISNFEYLMYLNRLAFILFYSITVVTKESILE